MRVDSLERLQMAFGSWRKGKRHRSERVPDGLIEQARHVAAVHGAGAVVKAVGIDYRKLVDGMTTGEVSASRGRAKKAAALVPSYSRIALHSPAALPPLAEVETPTGMKVRLFQVTAETFALLSALGAIGSAP